ncbi:MAG: hypothetical protein KDD40_06495, partial [Bdellovibrionales bacterium]|nr:hypothetical protein [Bdellovibrionales bacterium]
VNFLAKSFSNGSYRKLDNEYLAMVREPVQIIQNLKVINDYRCNKSKKNVSAYRKLNIKNERSYFYLMGSDLTKFFKLLMEAKVVQKKYGAKAKQVVVKAIVDSFAEIDDYLKDNFFEKVLSPIKSIEIVLKQLQLENDPEICFLLFKLYRSYPKCLFEYKRGPHEV